MIKDLDSGVIKLTWFLWSRDISMYVTGFFKLQCNMHMDKYI